MRQRIQAALLAAVVLLSAAVCAPQAAAAGTVTVSQVSGAKGELVDMTITLTSDDVCSGNFNVNYDSSALELVSAAATEEFQCLTNPYGEGKVRVSFVRLTPIADAVLCTLTFRVTEETGADGSTVTLEQVKLYNENSGMVAADVIQGAVSRKTVRLSMSASDTAEYQAVRAVVELGGTLSPAGGNFSISYDPACFEVKSVVALEAMGGAVWQYSIAQPGLVRISFSSATALDAGRLCAVVFQTVGSAGAGSQLTIADAKMYDENAAAMDAAVENGSLDIVVPSDKDPKLWVVGGAMQEDGGAKAAVILQGRGYACGGNFTLTYDPGMTAVVEALADCQINHDPASGTIRVSWAAAAPYSGETELLTLTFADALESTVGIGNVTLYYAEGKAIPVVDVRPGQITAERTVSAVVDEVTVEAVGSVSTYNVAVDVTDIGYFSQETVESVTPVLALYEEGRMVGLNMPAASAFSSGTNEIVLTAQTDRSVSNVSVFLLDGAGAMQPLCSALKVETAEN